MSDEKDLAAALPNPPFPAPARREAAIGAAMRRFDGVEDTAPARTAEPAAVPGWRGSMRPYAGALVGTALIALIALPLTWTAMEDAPIEQSPQAADVRTAAPLPRVQFEPETADVAEATQTDPQAAPTENDAAASVRQQAVPPVGTEAKAKTGTDTESYRLADAAAVPPPPSGLQQPETAPAEKPASEAERHNMAVASRLAERRRMAPAAPAARAEATDAADGESDNIVVTSARVQRGKASQRGDWNACTIDDPGRDIRACRRQVDPGAGGARGRVDTHIADGLSRAWQGDEQGAIAAFDQAIAASPRSSLAYLNRGLAHRRAGDLDQALADLNQAVRLSPGSARAYYLRSLLHRQRGDRLKADADATRAADLDPRYKDLTR